MCRFVLLVEFLDGLDLFLELHAPVLEPNFDLALCQAQGVGHFDPPPSRQVMIRMELFLEFQRLVACVRLTAATPESIGTLKRENTIMLTSLVLRQNNSTRHSKKERSRPWHSFPTTSGDKIRPQDRFIRAVRYWGSLGEGSDRRGDCQVAVGAAL